MIRWLGILCLLTAAVIGFLAGFTVLPELGWPDPTTIALVAAGLLLLHFPYNEVVQQR